MMIPKFIDHRIAPTVFDFVGAVLFEYMMAGNGLFVRASRSEFDASLMVCSQKIKGLPEIRTGIFWHKPKPGSDIWGQILADARFRNDFEEFREDVYAVYWDEPASDWRWRNISRERHGASTIADDASEEYSRACIELHTHPAGAVHFSSADDRDESGKFRIFGILIDIHSLSPRIRFRCGIYDHFFQIQADWVGVMPSGVIDLNSSIQTI